MCVCAALPGKALVQGLERFQQKCPAALPPIKQLGGPARIARHLSNWAAMPPGAARAVLRKKAKQNKGFGERCDSI